MTALEENWLPLSPGERAVAIEVLTHGPLSRGELARRLGLSAGSLTRLTKPLTESGLLVAEPALAAAGQGRPAQPLDVVADSRHFAGFKITADAVYGVVTTLRSEVVARCTVPLDTHEPDGVAALLAALTREFATSFPRLAGIGIGIAGPTRARGVVVANTFLGWADVPLADLVRARAGLPVVVDNDVTALAEAEAWFGGGRGLDRFALLTIGAGIGYALVVGGRPVRTGDAGRGIGRRWIVDPYGPLTPDGERGTAGALLGIPAICRQVHAATGRPATYPEVLARAAAGEPVASRVIDEAARALGVMVAQIAELALPQKILLAGEGVGLLDVAGDVVAATIRARRHPDADPVPLETGPHDFHGWARGSAVLAIQVLVLGAATP
ncbi:ROK family transcriptional regulator [Streptomyces longispororuber]|uniref:ROK family transcriptional regulator n=1 Tax=Streptomyces longispororuber TaxID=68230 RepID=UPI00210A1290|nr:ROK family transcriptional regulator [Streptomyces longispororuber]MCQ4209283.1 ROK family transcriptional regulator [Streptomyces longispororuber]